MGFNFGIENIIHANAFSFAAMVGIFYFLGKKLKLGDAVASISVKIKEAVDNSEKRKADSATDLRSAQVDMEKLPQQIDELCQEARNTAAGLSEKIKEEAENKTKIIEENTKKTIDYEIKTTKDILSKDVSKASLKIAQDNMQQVLDKDEAMHKRIIEECIDAI